MGVHYFWDPVEDNIIEEYDDNGNVIAEYTTEPGYHGAVISEHRDGVSRFHIRDGDGNTVALTDEQGNVTDTFGYTAGGELTERTGTTPTPYQYKSEYGYYTDQTTGQIMVRRRKLHPPTGRWLSVDPIALDQSGVIFLRYNLGENVYLICRNNPMNGRDPSGLACECGVDPDPCKGKLRTAKICIVKWHGSTLAAKDLNLDAVNTIWKQCCIRFEEGDSYVISKDDTVRNIGDDFKYDHPKDNDNVALRLYIASRRQDDCIFVNFFKEAGGFDDLVLAQAVSGEILNWKYCFVAFNQGIDWMKNIGQTAAHEFGHCLGLEHCAEKEKTEGMGCAADTKPCDNDHLMHYAPSSTGKSKLTEDECKKANASLYLGKAM